jgi:predicted Fe-Mo cluster-binding NifX family protein
LGEDLLKLAIPIFESRVSPRFDHAPRLLVISLNEKRVVSREEYSLDNLGAWQRLSMLKRLGVELMICGGIDKNSHSWLIENHIQVISLVTGNTSSAVEDFIAGRLKNPDQITGSGLT